MDTKSKLGNLIYWWAIGIGGIFVAGGVVAAFDRWHWEPLLVTGAFALGAWLVGRAARDVLSAKQGGP